MIITLFSDKSLYENFQVEIWFLSSSVIQSNLTTFANLEGFLLQIIQESKETE